MTILLVVVAMVAVFFINYLIGLCSQPVIKRF